MYPGMQPVDSSHLMSQMSQLQLTSDASATAADLCTADE